MTDEVQVAQRGVIILPKPLRDAYKLIPGTTFTIVDLGGGAFALMPHRSEIDHIADDIRDALANEGETLEAMLATLREKREQYGKR